MHESLQFIIIIIRSLQSRKKVMFALFTLKSNYDNNKGEQETFIHYISRCLTRWNSAFQSDHSKASDHAYSTLPEVETRLKVITLELSEYQVLFTS